MTARAGGIWISFEGGEGAGKSTQAKLLTEASSASGRTAILTREPGGSDGAETIRSLIVTGEAGRWDATTETLLIMAARADHLSRTIRPALARGEVVICDRFLDSTRVYQGIAKGLGMAWVDAMHRQCFGNEMPHLTFYLDIDPAIGLARTASRSGNETRFESMDISFHQRLRDGFLNLCTRDPERIIRVDATQNTEAVQSEILSALKRRLGLSL